MANKLSKVSTERPRTKLELVRGRFGFWWVAAGEPPMYYGPFVDESAATTGRDWIRALLGEATPAGIVDTVSKFLDYVGGRDADDE